MNIIEALRGDYIERRVSEALGSYSRGMSRAVSMLAREDVGWVGADSQRDAVPLPVIKEHSQRARHLVAYNPLVKRGITIRNAYMWYDMPEVVTRSALSDTVQEDLLSRDARVRDESALCTDGAVIYLVSKSKKIARPVPLSRVAGVARSEDSGFEGDIHAFLINEVKNDPTIENKPKWFCVHGKSPALPDDTHEVDREWTVVYAMVNRQIGEIWGKPDLMGAVYWAKAYKEYLEAAYTMSRALARIAFKVQAPTQRQQQAVIQQMSGLQGVGGTATFGAGQELSAVSKAGAGIEFSAGTPLASMVSAALDVPLSVLLTDGSAGGRQGAETALEEPTFKAFEARRHLHVSIISRVLDAMGVSHEITMVPLASELIQRWAQTITLGITNGMLHQVEARQLFLDRLQPRNALAVDDLPELPEVEPSDSVGPLSDGTNANRDEDGGETVA